MSRRGGRLRSTRYSTFTDFTFLLHYFVIAGADGRARGFMEGRIRVNRSELSGARARARWVDFVSVGEVLFYPAHAL